MPVPEPVNLRIKLSPTRRRMAKSMQRLFQIIGNSDAKLYNLAKPKAFLPIFPTSDAAIQAAITVIFNRLEIVINPNL